MEFYELIIARNELITIKNTVLLQDPKPVDYEQKEKELFDKIAILNSLIKLFELDIKVSKTAKVILHNCINNISKVILDTKNDYRRVDDSEDIVECPFNKLNIEIGNNSILDDITNYCSDEDISWT